MEKLESRGVGTHSINYVGGLLWLLLVEGHRYESYDAFEMVEGYGSEGVRSVSDMYNTIALD
jgi:hypothetical protein